MKKLFVTLLVVLGFANFSLKAQTTVVDIVVNSEDHTILETAVVAAGLVETLSGDGPFTVFAPTDAAFGALPEGTLDALLADPSGDLTDILLYHVHPGSITSGELFHGQMISTVFGKDLEVTVNGGVYINDALVISADVHTDNGVVHVIDAVLLPPAPVTVVDIVVGSEDHTILETAVIAAELDDDLSAEGPFTVFAPTDAAFGALPEGALDSLLADPTGDLANVLLYHVASGSVMSGDLSDGQMITTLFGKDVEVSINGGVYINDAMVTVADIETDNGVVHVIDAVLLPPAPVTVVDIVVGSEDHTILETAVIAAELVDDLSAEGPFTVFAPTDAAFEALPEGTLDALIADPTGELANVLLYHVASGSVMSGDLSDGQMITTLFGEDVEVSIDGGVYINDAMVIAADIETDNGVVHVIDAVLLPPAPVTVVDIIVGSEDHTILETAVIAAELDDDLSAEGPFTVFAPTDAAFGALPEGTLDALLADPTGDLANILLYHVASGSVMSGDLSDGQMITTLFGEDVEVSIDGGVYINDAMVTAADIETDNGVVHVIDAVLIPGATTDLDAFNTSFDVEMFPNPATEWVKVNLESIEEGNFNAMILSTSGAVVREYSLQNNSGELDLSGITPGVYMIRFESSTGVNKLEKLIVQ